MQLSGGHCVGSRMVQIRRLLSSRPSFLHRNKGNTVTGQVLITRHEKCFHDSNTRRLCPTATIREKFFGLSISKPTAVSTRCMKTREELWSGAACCLSDPASLLAASLSKRPQIGTRPASQPAKSAACCRTPKRLGVSVPFSTVERLKPGASNTSVGTDRKAPQHD